MPRNVVVITTAFPFESVTEKVFVMPDVEALSREFDRVIIVPLLRRGEMAAINLPNVIIDTWIADSASTRCKLLKFPALASRYAFRNYGDIRKCSKGMRQFISRAFYAINVENTRRQLKKVIKRHGLSPDSTLFYSFWFDFPTISLAELSNDAPLRIVSRAHGYDIYDDIVPNRPPCLRRDALTRISRLFPASLDGERYLKNAYPGNDGKISRRVLGSIKQYPDFITPCSNTEDSCVTFLSVARVSAGKGVGRNLQFVKAYAGLCSGLQIKWIHVGDGPEMNCLRKMCGKESCPANLTVDLRGALPNSAVHDIYHDYKIDWVLLFSDSEGGCPIVISEALSYGVPVVAYTVGGVSEIMTSETGIIFPHGTSPEIMAAKAMQTTANRGVYEKMKQCAVARWEQGFDARKLRADFAAELRNLIDNRHE